LIRQRRRLRALLRLERRRLGLFAKRQRRRLVRAIEISKAALHWTLVQARRAAKLGVAVVIVSLLLGGTAYAASSLYAGFGPPREPANRLAWADRTLHYATSQCADCHATETALAASSGHATVSCELCHTPTVVHPGTVAGAVAALPASTSATCVACHADLAGRPAGQPEVDTSAHYPLVDCLACHDPHTALAISPPEVTHPLEHLPACTTCHSPVGLKRYPAGHQPAADAVCLGCHKPQAVTE
jgi:hypothetical protein